MEVSMLFVRAITEDFHIFRSQGESSSVFDGVSMYTELLVHMGTYCQVIKAGRRYEVSKTSTRNGHPRYCGCRVTKIYRNLSKSIEIHRKRR